MTSERPEHDSWSKLNEEIITCTRCPRLVAWREEVARVKRRAFQDWTYWGRPLPGFGDHEARIVVIGLAPGAHGSNRTGRMFTGDGSGETFYGALYRTGFANQPTARHRDDGLTLRDIFVTAVARCAPPGNRPTPDEIGNCRSYLARELALLQRVQLIVALGQIALNGTLQLLRDQGYDLPRVEFRHGEEIELPTGLPRVLVSYHPSRQNTQTGRLTLAMFDAIFERAREQVR
jgi:uracil-DNA glycosylase